MNIFPGLLSPLKTLDLYPQIDDHLKEDNLRSDRFMLYLIIIHWVTATFITALTYDTYLFGFTAGGTLFFLALAFYLRYQGTRTFRIVAAFSLITFSAIFIQQHLGRIEFHFHVFVALAFLTVYKDYIPLLAGALFTTVHHFLFNYLQSVDIHIGGMKLIIFNYGCGYEIVVIHTVFVIFETIMLFYITVLRQRSFQKILQTSTRLAYLNDHLEKEVADKTEALQASIDQLQAANTELTNARNKAMMANEARSNFISSVSHELRTPLNAIINFTDMVIEDFDGMCDDPVLKKENKEFLSRVFKNSKHLLSLINDILEFTRAEAGKMEYDLERSGINTLVHNAYVNCQGLTSSAPIDVRLELSSKDPIALIDKRRFFQVILNLISNAIKFTTQGFIAIRTRETGHHIIVEVEDSGRGIPSEKLNIIFQPFEQVTKYDSGTGLGLVIVKKLCDDMHIDLKVASVLGKGSKFTLILNKVSEHGSDQDINR